MAQATVVNKGLHKRLKKKQCISRELPVSSVHSCVYASVASSMPALLTLPYDAVVLDHQHLGRDKHVLHLLQELWSEAGDGDLLCRHKGGQGGVHPAPAVGQAGEDHGASYGG